MTMLIDITDANTYPKMIESAVNTYLSKLSTNISNTIRGNQIEFSGDVVCAIEDYLGIYKADALYNDVLASLEKYCLISYHATKVLNTDSIKRSGLLTNTWDRYKDALTNTLKELSIDNDDIDSAIDIVKHEYDRKYTEHDRKAQLCFYSGMHLFENNKDIVGCDQFCENIGGELVRWSLKEKMPSVYKTLKDNGVAIVVKVALPFTDIASYQKDKIAFQFICYYAAKSFWSYEYEIDYDCITEKDVTPDKILEIIPVTESIDY